MKSIQLRQEQAKLVSEMRKILDLASSEKRDITSDENINYENLNTQVEKLDERIEAVEKLEQREQAANEIITRAERSGGFTASKGAGSNGDEKLAAFRSYIKGGLKNLSHQEIRTLTQGTNSAGGYLVPDEQFVAKLLQKQDDLLFIRQLATKIKIDNAKAGGIPTLTTDFGDCNWTTEILTGSEDNLVFGKRTLTPTPLAKRVKISNTLLNNAAVDPESVVLDRLAFRFAATEEKYFLTGSGSSQPLGLFTASANGISTGRDVSTGNTSTAVTFDGLIEAQESVKDQYQKNASWLLSRSLRKMVRKLKDSQNQYIWEASTQVGAPPTLLGHAVYVSEYVPATFTTGLYVGLYGDMSYYWIVDSLDQQIKRLDELYAETNEVGFIGRKETDGAPALEEAFARVKLA
jgi:HK97 family phage major capsid protein